MNNHRHHISSLAFVLSSVIAAPASAAVDYGALTTIGEGWARTYVQKENGAPTRIGLQFDQAAFDAFAGWGATSIQLGLPGQAPAPFNHLTLDWNPGGHPGPGYHEAHFDFHFYFMSPEEVAAIPFDSSPVPVDPRYVAPGYVPDPVVVPKMGHHYLDSWAPEFNGHEFSHTLVYGYYQGRMSFLEPMIRYTTLQQGGSYLLPIRQPIQFAAAGFYPTEYGFSLENGVFDIFLGGLSARPGAAVPDHATTGVLTASALGALALIRRTRRAERRADVLAVS
jgi:hypothetical protein